MFKIFSVLGLVTFLAIGSVGCSTSTDYTFPGNEVGGSGDAASSNN